MKEIKILLAKIEERLAKDGINGDWHDDGLTFRVKDGTKHLGHRIFIYNGKKRVGHIAYSKQADKEGYHEVYNSNLEEAHRGKGLYQEMLRRGVEHVKSLGSKGLKSSGYQRSSDATRAWKKINPEVKPGVQHALLGEKADVYYADERHLKKSALEKGSMQRLAPFNPEGALGEEGQSNLATWQGIHSEQRPAAREAAPKIDGNARIRALHKLSGSTKTRLGPDGKRQFLLHRGMAQEEYQGFSNKTHVSNTANHTSWTPREDLANNFANPYSKTPGKRVAAWVHEDDIHTIPKQFGSLDKEYEASSGSRQNRMAIEHEVIVRRGHRSEIESVSDPQKPTTYMQGRITETPKDLNDSINMRGQKEARDARLYGRKLSKAREDKLVPAEGRKAYRKARREFEGKDELANQLTPVKGVSDVGIEVRRADPKIPGAVAHGYQRVSSPEKHKATAKEMLVSLKNKIRNTLPK